MTLLSGSRLGHFDIIAPLGAGAMGEVYRARDHRLERDVALKVLPARTVGDAQARKRLRAEALALSKLNHPNIAAIYEFDTDDDVDFLVMEFVEGETLAARLQSGSLPEGDVTSIALQVADALQEAHARGIVHRDLKPGNIMLTTRDRAKVLDFGLARSLLPVAADASSESLSSAEAIVGTVPYMAPEQLRTGQVDTRADLYAVGVILYEMATGQRPFAETGLGPLVKSILERTPEPPRRLNPALSPRLESIVLKALRKSADERHHSAEELIRELQGTAPVERRSVLRGHRIGNLPQPRTSFVGRERESIEVKACLESTRLLTLTGSGGCGKTRLAIASAETVRDAYPDGVWLVELAAVQDALVVPQTVAAVFGIREQPGRSLSDTLAESFASQAMLIVIDNCEHVVGAAGQLVEAILDAGPAPRVLATSREALGVAGEVARRVPSLSVPDDGELEASGASVKRPSIGTAEAARAYEAVRLFEERAKTAVPSFQLTDGNAAVVARICRRLDGIPLAIELAAARLKLLAPEEIETRLDDCFRLLTKGGRVGLPRHQTLRALIDWSYDLLDDREKLVFRRLSVFAGAWSVATAEAVCGDPPGHSSSAEPIAPGQVLDIVTALVDKSLILIQEVVGERRCRLLETVRQYAADRLVESGEASALKNRHCDHFRTVAQENEIGRSVEEFQRLHDAYDDLRAALEWSLKGGVPETGLQIATHLVNYWSGPGSMSEGRMWLVTLLDRADRAPAAMRARAIRKLGKIYWLETNFEEAESCYRQTIAFYGEVGDLKGVAGAYQGIGSVTRHRGDYRAARDAFEQALALFRELGSREGMGGVLNDLGIVASNERDIERAIDLYQESLSIAREVGDVWAIASRLGNLAEVTTWKGDIDRALQLHRESLNLWVELGDRRSIAEGLEMFAETLCAQGRMDRVATVLGAVEALREEIGCPRPPVDDDLIEGAAAAAAAALGDDAFRRAWAGGRAMQQAEAVAYALEERVTSGTQPPGSTATRSARAGPSRTSG